MKNKITVLSLILLAVAAAPRASMASSQTCENVFSSDSGGGGGAFGGIIIFTSAPPLWSLSAIGCAISGDTPFAEVEESYIRQEAALVIEHNQVYQRSFLRTYSAAKGYESPQAAAHAVMGAKRGEIAKTMREFHKTLGSRE